MVRPIRTGHFNRMPNPPLFSMRKMGFVKTFIWLAALLCAVARAADYPEPFYRTLSEPSMGNDVHLLQALLRRCADQDVRDDAGVFGASTRRGVAALQSDAGLEADGIAGPRTLKLLATDACFADGYGPPASGLVLLEQCGGAKRGDANEG